MSASMSDEHESEVLGGLPHRRPHRRSDKRGARPAGPSPEATGTASTAARAAKPAAARKTKPPAARATKPAPVPASEPPPPEVAAASRPAAMTGKAGPARLRQPAQPEGTPTSPPRRRPAPATGADILGTAVQAAAELAEIGLSASARAIRSAVSKLPRP